MATEVIAVQPRPSVREAQVDAVELWCQSFWRTVLFYVLCVLSGGLLALFSLWCPWLSFRIRCHREGADLSRATHVRVREGNMRASRLVPVRRVRMPVSELLLLLREERSTDGCVSGCPVGPTTELDTTATPKPLPGYSSDETSSVASDSETVHTKRPLLSQTSEGGAACERLETPYCLLEGCTTGRSVALPISGATEVQPEATALVFEWRCLRYVYNPWRSGFVWLSFPFEDTVCSEAAATFEGDIGPELREVRLQAFGPAVAELQPEPLLQMTVREVLHPFYVFQAAAIGLWLWDEYYQYACAVLVITIFSLLAELYHMRTAQLRLWRLGGTVSQHVRLRNGEDNWRTIASKDLVPGDVLLVETGLRMPCDVLLLGGQAVMNECTLTGESTPVTKSCVAGPDCVRTTRNASMIFGGTAVVQGRHSWGVVVRTGFTTCHGEMLRALTHPAMKREHFVRDSMLFLAVLVSLACVGFALAIVFTLMNHLEKSVVAIRALDTFTNAVPPALPATMAVGSSLAVARLLKVWQVSCVLPRAVNIAGRSRTVVLDKTGTMTVNGLQLEGVVRVHPRRRGGGNSSSGEGQGYDLDPTVLEPNADSMCGPPPSGKQQRNDAGNAVPFHELLGVCAACCNSLCMLDGESVGDPLDVAVLNAVGAKLCGTTDRVKLRDRTWRVTRTFDFASALQRMSVLAHPEGKEDELYVFTKGSPEMVERFCGRGLIPHSWSHCVTQHTANGRRVLALAARRVAKGATVTSTRAEAEQDLHPLGLLLFSNPLKPQVEEAIRDLQNAGVTCVMATGDAPLTAFAVAGEAGIRTSDSTAMCLDWRGGQLACSVLVTDSKAGNYMREVRGLHDLAGLDPRAVDLVVTGAAFEQLLALHHCMRLPFAPAWNGTPLPPIFSQRKSSATFAAHVTKCADAQVPEWMMRLITVRVDERSDAVGPGIATLELPPISYSERTGDLEKWGGGNSTGCTRASSRRCSSSDSRTVHMSMLEYTLRFGRVFARMSPEHKACLVQALQELPWGPVVAMCGDGANDCSAMRQADFSLSVGNGASSSAAATFAASGMESLAHILREGRAALCNSFQQFKFVALYALVQLTTTVCLYYFGGNLTDPQYLWMDLVVALPLTMTSAWTASNRQLTFELPDSYLVGRQVLTAVLGQITIQLAFLGLVLNLLFGSDFYVPFQPNSEAERFEPDDLKGFENTVIFVVSNFQIIALSLAFSFSRPWRKPAWTNWVYTTVFVLLMVLSVGSMVCPLCWALQWLVSWLTLVPLPAWFRGAMGAVIAANFSVTCAFEWWFIQRRVRRKVKDMPAQPISAVVLPPLCSSGGRRCAFVV